MRIRSEIKIQSAAYEKKQYYVLSQSFPSYLCPTPTLRNRKRRIEKPTSFKRSTITPY